MRHYSFLPTKDQETNPLDSRMSRGKHGNPQEISFQFPGPNENCFATFSFLPPVSRTLAHTMEVEPAKIINV